MSGKKEQKRRALLQAALELFAENGFNGASTALIAERAGVASGTLFFHFKSKEELIHSLFKEIREKIDTEVLKDVSADLSIRERLHRMLFNLLRYFLDNPAEFKFAELYHYSPLNDQGQGFREENQVFHALLLQAREQRIIKNFPLLCLEALAFGPLSSLAKEHANRGTPVDDEMVRLTISSCWEALKS
ncbi:TetR/AcrR family transcriptional regulator [Desulfuromonas sp. KJ2020]|uniref:TetR/AcrR family transcriptional regulator n=1 Tax=Desulfuromonas sp. KJ2020 TaxID=2919173 RepID=UPI0020A7B749|nr:TetR/AcrR family transcriptional regulator [Desulfuromonas sp. KJ2020]MCP3178041.1 TetR/AcrR family transcriptional regulator [Desulfuromonas sp. KJ2020]